MNEDLRAFLIVVSIGILLTGIIMIPILLIYFPKEKIQDDCLEDFAIKACEDRNAEFDIVFLEGHKFRCLEERQGITLRFLEDEIQTCKEQRRNKK